MVSFRKTFLLLALMVTVASIAGAQTALCTAYTSNAPNVRSEGVAEEVGQVIIDCTGGTSGARGTAINNRINIQIFLDTQVTSRRTNSSGNVALESLLLIDNPAPTQVTTATMCPIDTVCPAYAGGAGLYNDPGGIIPVGGTTPVMNPNVFQGRQASSNSIIWQGVPFDAPGTTPHRYLRIVNVRANASGLPVSTLLPTPVRMYITISGTGAPNLTVNQLEVAYVLEGLQFGAHPDDALSFLQCESSSGDYGSSGVKAFRIRFRERFPTAFRDNNIPTGNQADLTQIYNTESMYYHPTVAGVWPGTGLATQPTRLMAKLSGIPANVRVRVPRQVLSSVGDVADYVQCYDGSTFLGQNCSAALLSGSTVTLDPVGGVVYLVYEVTTSVAPLIATLDVRTELLWSAGVDPTAPSISVTGSYAPISTTTAATIGPAPRFVDSAKGPISVFINPCRTNLLFPYVTNQGGFDTGLVISNTSADRFGTVPQNGTCTLDYFGNINGAAIPDASASQTTEVITAGTQAIGLVSSGIKGTPGLPGFGGYVIAKCNFQYAHGYAFLYTGGAAFNGASGYLALVLDGDKDFGKLTERTANTA